MIRYLANNNFRVPALSLLLTGFLIRTLWAIYFPNNLYADSEWYYTQAINLAQNKGYIYQGAPSAIWPVGYPAFLSLVFRLVGSSLLVAKFTNVLLLTLDLALIWWFSRIAANHRFTAILTLAVMSMFPSYIFSSSIVAAEPLYACCLHLFLVVMLLAIRQDATWLWLVAALLIGLLTYIRSEAVGYTGALLIAITSVRWQRGLRHWGTMSLMFVAIVAAMLTPWAIRNWMSLGIFVPTSTTGCMNLWIGNSQYANGGFIWPRDAAINPTVLRPDDTEQTWYSRSCAAALNEIRRDPTRMVRLLPAKIFYLWSDQDDFVHWNFASVTDPAVQIYATSFSQLANWYYYPILWGGILAAGWQVMKRLSRFFTRNQSQEIKLSHSYLLLLGVLLLSTLSYLPFFGTSRFVYGLMPVLVFFTVESMFTFSSWIRIKSL